MTTANGSPQTPNYRRLTSGELRRRSAALLEEYADCALCPYECGVDRTDGETGACRADDTVSVAAAHPHHGEEDVLRGRNGSGTIFLSNCPLSCVFCQNFDISQEGRGRAAPIEEIAEMAIDLQECGCHNVNFVTPTHYAPSLAEAIRLAREEGLELPIVWNCGGYERAEAIAALEGFVDIYMPDVKWADDEAAATYSNAPDYWTHCKASLREMHRQVGDLTIDENGLATKGLLVRHLVMPNHVENSRSILTFLAEELSEETFVNVMGQYRPHYRVGTDDRYAEIDRGITRREYREVADHARDVGLERAQIDQ